MKDIGGREAGPERGEEDQSACTGQPSTQNKTTKQSFFCFQNPEIGLVWRKSSLRGSHARSARAAHVRTVLHSDSLFKGGQYHQGLLEVLVVLFENLTAILQRRWIRNKRGHSRKRREEKV